MAHRRDEAGAEAGDPIGEELAEPVPRGGVKQVIVYLRSLVDTMMAAHDRLYIEENDFARTIAIDTLGVGTTEFDLSSERAMGLYESGRTAAEEFLTQAPAELGPAHR